MKNENEEKGRESKKGKGKLSESENGNERGKGKGKENGRGSEKNGKDMNDYGVDLVPGPAQGGVPGNEKGLVPLKESKSHVQDKMRTHR